MPRLTIGMPVFNDKEFIKESLESLLKQTFNDFILIISDDCSTDGSSEICMEYALKDSRIKYIRQAVNLGISKNMKFLLQQSQTNYFMWAADDDLWAPSFIEELILLLEKSSNAISAFCSYSFIDERGETVDSLKSIDYANKNRKGRLKYFIRNADDCFGYGIFITEKILDVEFPIWWGPNKKSAYNNIFPSLCYYLAKGDYIHKYGDALFFKRIKSNEKIHHVSPYSYNGTKEFLVYILRRFNLVIFSIKMINKGGQILLALSVSPLLFYYWLLKPVLKILKKKIINK